MGSCLLADMIDWEHDMGDRLASKQLPILELQLHIDPKDREKLVKHIFYQKGITNKAIVAAESSMPTKIQFSTLVEELCQRLRTTLSSLLEAERDDLVREFNAGMLKANHSQKFRLKVTQAALPRFSALQEDNREGEDKNYTGTEKRS